MYACEIKHQAQPFNKANSFGERRKEHLRQGFYFGKEMRKYKNKMNPIIIIYGTGAILLSCDKPW